MSTLNQMRIFRKPFPRKGMETFLLDVHQEPQEHSAFANLFPARGWKQRFSVPRLLKTLAFANLFPARGWKRYS